MPNYIMIYVTNSTRTALLLQYLKKEKLHVEFDHILFKASALVERILRAEHSQILVCFMKVFIHFIQIGFFEVASILRDFIKKMFEKVIRGEHPWSQICRLFEKLDSKPLDLTMTQIWKCIIDTFESEFGAFSRFAVSVHLDYIKRVYEFKEYFKEERFFRDFLAQFDDISKVSISRMMLNLTHNLNRQRRYDETKKITLKVFSLLELNKIYAKKIVKRIEYMKIISHNQFY